ncbi:MAG: flavin reductase family protein [Clostridia bacterium]|nr:flavin reductase family protein [Clostridia bacterium]
MSKEIWKGGALLAPLPAVLVSCRGRDKDGALAENVFTVAWTGIVNTIPPKTYISVRKSRYSYDIIKNSGKFVINIPTASLAKKVDYCGIYTGKKVNKFEKCAFTVEDAREVGAPCIAECPLCLECRVTDIVELGTHDMFVADILCTGVDSSIVDKDGKLRLDRAGLMAFAHGEYFELGRKLGYFGFSTKKKGHGNRKPHNSKNHTRKEHKK